MMLQNTWATIGDRRWPANGQIAPCLVARKDANSPLFVAGWLNCSASSDTRGQCHSSKVIEIQRKQQRFDEGTASVF